METPLLSTDAIQAWAPRATVPKDEEEDVAILGVTRVRRVDWTKPCPPSLCGLSSCADSLVLSGCVSRFPQAPALARLIFFSWLLLVADLTLGVITAGNAFWGCFKKEPKNLLLPVILI